MGPRSSPAWLPPIIAIVVCIVGGASAAWTQPGADAQHTNTVAQDLASPTLNVAYEFKGQHLFTPAVYLSSGEAVVGSEDNKVYAFQELQGLKQFFGNKPVTAWEFSSSLAFQASPSLSPDGSVVYAGGRDGFLYALGAHNGSMLWKVAVNENGVQTASPVVRPDNTIFLGTTDGGFFSVNGSSGKINWQCMTQYSVEGSPAVGADGSFYATATDNNVYKFAQGTCPSGSSGTSSPCDATQGCAAWSVNPNGRVLTSNPVVGVGASGTGTDDVVFVGATYTPADANNPEVLGGVWALKSDQGTTVWSYQIAGTVKTGMALNALACSKGRLCSSATMVFGASNGVIYKLNATTGELLWNTTVGGSVDTTPFIAGSSVVATTGDGRLVVLSFATGELLSTFDTGTSQALSSPTIGPSGVITFSTVGGSFYAVGNGSNWMVVRFAAGCFLALALFASCCGICYCRHYSKTGRHMDKMDFTQPLGQSGDGQAPLLSPKDPPTPYGSQNL